MLLWYVLGRATYLFFSRSFFCVEIITLLLWGAGAPHFFVRYLFMGNKVAEWVNQNLSFREEYRSIFGHDAPYGNVHCCFHDNTGTPAAKIYGNVMKCFGACGRTFTVYDLLRRHAPHRLREVESSGVIPESSLLLRGSVVSDSFSYVRLGDIPVGVGVGTFEFFTHLIG